MSNNIGWCDCTINPVVGCTKCSPGCEHCYAERFAARLAKNPATAKKYAGVVDERGRWTGKINFGTSRNDNDMPHDAPGKNKRVFVGSMSDLFHPNVRDLTRDVIFASILCDLIRAKSKGHTFMILTKRAKEMCDYFSTGQSLVAHWWGGVEPEEEVTWPLPNLWAGVTVCNQEEADSKIPALLRTPAAKRFISVEPMLGPIDLEAVSFKHSDGFFGSALRWHHLPHGCCDKDYPALDWVICGGETGPKARPMHPDWVRSLRDQCVEAGVPFYFKGWGGSGKYGPALLDGKVWHQFPAQEEA